jgi:ribosome-binding factor A
MSERTARLDELLREEISAIVSREVHDPRIGFVTVTSVDVTPDLRHANVWVSFIGQPGERKDALRALGRAMPFVRQKLGVLRLKRIPDLHLKLDETAERGTRVLQLLQELEEGRDPTAAPVTETLPTPSPRGSERDDLIVPPPEPLPGQRSRRTRPGREGRKGR